MKHAPLFALLLLFSTGCAGSFEEARAPKRVAAAPPPSARCIDLDSQHRFWGGASKFSATLSGASGLGAIPVEDKNWRVGLAISGAGLAAIAVSSGFISESASESWARECSAP